MSSLDLYDDLFPEETYNRDENGEANVSEETGSSLLNTKDKNIKTQMKKVEEYNKKLESELNVLKKENKNWQLVYRDVERKLEMSKKNVTILLKTTRNEISRKNDTISCLKREIDNMLFKRAVKSGTVNELKEMIDKIHSAFQIEISGKNQTDITTKSDKNGEPKKPSNILNKPVLNDNKKPRDGRAKERDEQSLSLTDKNILRNKIKMPAGMEYGTVYKNENERQFSKIHINDKKSTVNVQDVSLNDEMKRQNYNKSDDESSLKRERNSSVCRNREERSAQLRKSNYNDRNLRQDMERENRSKRKRSSRSPSPKSYSKHTSTLVKEVKRKYRRAPSLSPIRDRKRNSRRSDSRYSNVNKYASDRSRGDKSAFTETSVQRSSNSKDKPSNVPKKNRDVGGSIAVIPTHTEPIIEKNVPRDESPMEPAKLYSLANKTKPSVTDHEIDEEEITSSKEAEEGEITDDEKEEKDANASNINRKTSVTDFGGRSSNNSSSDKENNETLDENPNDTHNGSTYYLESNLSGNVNETRKSQNKIVLSLGKLLSGKGNEAVRIKMSSKHRSNAEHPDDLHNINTNDLETLIETKQQEMDQLKAEESVLLKRKKEYSTSNEKHVLIENKPDVIVNTGEKLSVNNSNVRNKDRDNKKHLDQSSLILKTLSSSKADCQDNAEVSKIKLSIEETSRSDKYHDFNSREGIANILKGTLSPGVANVSQRTGKIRAQSPSKSLTVKNKRIYGESSKLKMSNATVERQRNTRVRLKPQDKSGSTTNSKVKSTRQKELYRELGLEDSNSCSGLGGFENPSSLSRSKNHFVDLASSIGLSISDSSDDETENS